MSRTRTAGLLALLLLLCGIGTATSSLAQAPALEYQVKASLIYNLMQFVEWPSGETAADEFVICIIGEDRFGRALDAIEGDVIRNHVLRVRRLESNPADFSECAVAFISASESGRVDQILGDLKGQSTLTIGETDGFVQSGGIVNLKIVDGRIRFDVNRRSARLARLQISSKLLRLADQVVE